MNVLDHFAKKDQPEAGAWLKKMMYAPSRSHCERQRRAFALRYRKTHPKAVATLDRDWERMVTYYDFPKAHWIHLRTTNIVESPFNAVWRAPLPLTEKLSLYSYALRRDLRDRNELAGDILEAMRHLLGRRRSRAGFR